MTHPASAAPGGHEWQIEADGYLARITEIGAALRVLQHDGVDLIAGFAPDVMRPAARGQLLAPWPNRICDGRYLAGGEEYQLPLSEPERANAAHGLVGWVAWECIEERPDSVTLGLALHPQPGWAWSVRIEVRYVLDADGLRVEVSAENLSETLCPWGFGAHPYLTAGETSLDDAALRLAASSVIKTDERLIPVGTEASDLFASGDTVSLRGVILDNCFTNLAVSHGCWEVTLSCGERATTLWAQEQFRYVQLFTGDELPAPDTRRGIAVEPMTCPANAFNSGVDLTQLAPGERWEGAFGIRAHVRGLP